jgi:hypothetical protein
MNYLLIRPISEDPKDIEPYLDSLKNITGLDRTTLNQRLLGSAINVLMVHEDAKLLGDISEKLKDEGLLSSVVTKEELRRPSKARRASSVEINRDSIELLSNQGETLLKLDKTSPCLIVISSKNFKEINSKEIARHVMHFAEPMDPAERLAEIYKNGPVLDIYSFETEEPVRIDSAKFNYTSLGEKNRNATALNIPIILELISRFSSEVIIETGFGTNRLPFLPSIENADKDRAFRDFAIYSFMIHLVHTRGLFPSAITTGAESQIKGLVPVPFLDELTSVFWAGPQIGSTKKDKNKTKPKEEDGDESEEKIKLPMPPEEFKKKVIVSRLLRITMGAAPHYKKAVRRFGPKIIFYPLSFLFFSSWGLIYVFGTAEPLALSLFSGGLMIFSSALVLVKRKRLIENCPRSKIRSMPMGEVEVGGKAVQKYFLKSPYTYTNCVYYSYKIYDLEQTKDGSVMVLKEWGDSGSIPFYLEDDTGQTLILPKDAILHAGVTQRVSGDMLSAVFGVGSSNTRKVVETTIPAHHFLYIMGYAHRVSVSTETKKKEMTERLLDIKHDKARLKTYDTDGDGRIDAEEWDKAREDVEHEIFKEQLNAGKSRDEVAIGVHPTGGLFFISDKKEEHIVKSMAWKIPIYLAAGLGSTLVGLFFILKISKNKDILSVIYSFIAG